MMLRSLLRSFSLVPRGLLFPTAAASADPRPTSVSRGWDAGLGLGVALVLAPVASGCGSDDPGTEGSGFTTAGETAGDADADAGEEGGDGSDPYEWTPTDEYELRIDDSAPAPLTLEMDRAEVQELFGDVADEIKLLELDSMPLLTNTLDEIKAACGTDWKNDKDTPDYDCNLTTLGQTFEGPDGTWRTSAEFSVIRILTMTPANCRVNGTSMQGLQEVADFLNIGGGFSQILADSMEIPRTEEFLDTQAMALALRDNVLATHPNIGNDGRLTMTLADALADLATMADKYGPMPPHPGVVDPSYTPHGEVLGPDFQMKAVAESNLRVLDGADLSTGKDFVTIINDLVGPTFDDPAEFDFTDPERFSVTGLSPNPSVDLRFNVYEHPQFIQSCIGNDACVNNLPGNPVNPNGVWDIDPWLLEPQVSTAGISKYGDLEHQQCYPNDFICTAEVLVGQSPFPAGYAEFKVWFDIGNPPENQYVWELLMEVAQVQFHNNGYVEIPEGEGNVSFTLQDIPVGITGAEASEAVRPYLQEQSSEIANYLLGDYKKNNGPVDFYFRRAEDGNPYLYFVAQEDLQEGKAYGWSKPGFFSSASMDAASKVSSISIAGVADTSHEKWAPEPGNTRLYVQDDSGQAYRLTVTRPEASDGSVITVAIERRVD